MTDSVAPSRGSEQSAGASPAPAEAPAGQDPPKSPPSPPAFAAKANDLEALRGAVVDAANVSAGLWLSYLFVLLYLAIAAGSVTHRDLLFEKSVKLPFLNVELPLVAFFVMGPALFLVVHAYVLLHFMLLADKAGAFHQQLRLQIDDDGIRASLRRQLPSNVFVQFVAGPPGVRSGGVGLMFRLIAQLSLIVLPIGLLMLFQLQFLAYHSEPVSWWQRIAVVIDLVLIWAIWPSINRGVIARLRLRDFLHWPVAASALASLLVIMMVGAVATFPGEWLHTALPTLRIVPAAWSSDEPAAKGKERLSDTKFVSLHTLLIAGEADPITRRPVSVWSNRLVLPEFNAASASGEALALRGRRLEGAVLPGARLDGVDFTGAHLQEANFDGADLKGAQFGCGEALVKFDNFGKELRWSWKWVEDQVSKLANPRTNHDCVWLRGASMRNASLQGALLDGSQMQGVDLTRARLHGASMQLVNLDGASLFRADLPGVSLRGASLIGADLQSTGMSGVTLELSDLSAAKLNFANLQGAQFGEAGYEGAKFQGAFLWRSTVQGPYNDAAVQPWVREPVLDASYRRNIYVPCERSADDDCLWTPETFEALKRSLQENISDLKRRNDAIERISGLDPTTKDTESPKPSPWLNLENALPSESDFLKTRGKHLRAACCRNGGVDVIHALLKRRFDINMLEDRDVLKVFAGDLLEGKDCPEMKKLIEQDRELLERVKLSTGPFAP
ncbi:pentapeptide repeat-containing protein [Bradyrhizobium betae]|uniref:Pentapeptide repeat-containing protein n=1 Tax=Bradyrhizobium betae TaxID=244734 RepID=A0A4Q1VLI0_9BRAD|nr:pentapeptide repeat-containing protein [Bradyrhizobium betae]RXT52283.1 hypothetical protein B5V03_04225 [Bradyrhizobium betae]